MGAIQSSINQVLGTTAAGVTLAKHIGEQQEANKLKEEENALAKERQTESALNDLASVGEKKINLVDRILKEEKTQKNLFKENDALADLMKNPEAMKSDKDKEAAAQLFSEQYISLKKSDQALKIMEAERLANKLKEKRAKDVLAKAGGYEELTGGKK